MEWRNNEDWRNIKQWIAAMSKTQPNCIIECEIKYSDMSAARATRRQVWSFIYIYIYIYIYICSVEYTYFENPSCQAARFWISDRISTRCIFYCEICSTDYSVPIPVSLYLIVDALPCLSVDRPSLLQEYLKRDPQIAWSRQARWWKLVEFFSS